MKLKLIFFGLLVTSLSYSQTFFTNIDYESITSFRSYKPSIGTVDYGFSVLVSEYFAFNNHVAVGLGVGYSSAPYENTDNLNAPYSTYKTTIELETIKLPVILRYETKNYWIAEVSGGVLFGLNSRVKNTLSFLDGSIANEIKSELENVNFGFSEFNFGKGFSIGTWWFSFRLYYLMALNSHTYQDLNSSVYINDDYTLCPRQSGFKIGIEL